MTKNSVAKSKQMQKRAYTKKPAAQAVGQSTLATQQAQERTESAQIAAPMATRSLTGQSRKFTRKRRQRSHAKLICGQCDRPLFGAIRSTAKYCSSRCRKAAHRQRTKLPRAKQCAHCGDGFRPRNRLHKFCSVNCRTLSHRTLRKQLPSLIADAFSLPIESAWDALESSGTARVRSIVEGLGYSYSYRVRAWQVA